MAAVFGLVGIVLGAFLNPLGERIFREEPKEPFVPGAPSGDVAEVVRLNGSFGAARIEVSNESVDPMGTYRPKDVNEALVVGPGDRLHFRLACHVTSGARIELVALTLPSGLKILKEPRLSRDKQGSTSEGTDVNGISRAWLFDKSQPTTSILGSFDATADAQRPTYLTVYLGCTTESARGHAASESSPGPMSRAILRVAP
jgi:hypothetical protein